MSEKPCEKCDQWEDEYSRQKCYVREVQAGMTADTCGLLAHGMGHQEGYAVGESERDALRAEVERYKRAVDVLSDYFCPPIGSARCEQFCEKYSDCNDCMVEWALSEAGK